MTPPETLTCIVETPKGSRNKYEYDETLAWIRFDRFLSSPLVYRANYGGCPGHKKQNIPGRSQMGKCDLIKAIRKSR
jgi:inorganic pyrophosphatase